MEQTKFCTNCQKDVSEINFTIHVAHCHRNIQVCEICKEPVARNAVDEHMKEFHVTIHCEKCGKKMERWKLDHHEQLCDKRLVSCIFCELEQANDEIKEHEAYCGARTEQCQDCKQFVLRKDQETHVSVCLKVPSHKQLCDKWLVPFYVVPCIFCELEQPNDEIKEHEAYCSARTEQCQDCKQFVLRKDQETHASVCLKVPSHKTEEPHVLCPSCEISVKASMIETHEKLCPSAKRFIDFKKNTESAVTSDGEGIFDEDSSVMSILISKLKQGLNMFGGGLENFENKVLKTQVFDGYKLCAICEVPFVSDFYESRICDKCKSNYSSEKIEDSCTAKSSLNADKAPSAPLQEPEACTSVFCAAPGDIVMCALCGEPHVLDFERSAICDTCKGKYTHGNLDDSYKMAHGISRIKGNDVSSLSSEHGSKADKIDPYVHCVHCKKKFLLFRIDDHTATCSERSEACPLCSTKVNFRDKNDHLLLCVKKFEKEPDLPYSNGVSMKNLSRSQKKKMRKQKAKANKAESVKSTSPCINEFDVKVSIAKIGTERSDVRVSTDSFHTRAAEDHQPAYVRLNYLSHSDSVFLPCEFCSKPFRDFLLAEHQSGCRPDLLHYNHAGDRDEQQSYVEPADQQPISVKVNVKHSEAKCKTSLAEGEYRYAVAQNRFNENQVNASGPENRVRRVGNNFTMEAAAVEKSTNAYMSRNQPGLLHLTPSKFEEMRVFNGPVERSIAVAVDKEAIVIDADVHAEKSRLFDIVREKRKFYESKFESSDQSFLSLKAVKEVEPCNKRIERGAALRVVKNYSKLAAESTQPVLSSTRARGRRIDLANTNVKPGEFLQSLTKVQRPEFEDSSSDMSLKHSMPTTTKCVLKSPSSRTVLSSVPPKKPRFLHNETVSPTSTSLSLANEDENGNVYKFHNLPPGVAVEDILKNSPWKESADVTRNLFLPSEERFSLQENMNDLDSEDDSVIETLSEKCDNKYKVLSPLSPYNITSASSGQDYCGQGVRPKTFVAKGRKPMP